jgi:hypothetical protein
MSVLQIIVAVSWVIIVTLAILLLSEVRRVRPPDWSHVDDSHLHETPGPCFLCEQR